MWPPQVVVVAAGQAAARESRRLGLFVRSPRPAREARFPTWLHIRPNSVGFCGRQRVSRRPIRFGRYRGSPLPAVLSLCAAPIHPPVVPDLWAVPARTFSQMPAPGSPTEGLLCGRARVLLRTLRDLPGLQRRQLERANNDTRHRFVSRARALAHTTPPTPTRPPSLADAGVHPHSSTLLPLSSASMRTRAHTHTPPSFPSPSSLLPEA